MHERQFDWLTHALPLEKLNILQLFPQAKHETQRTGTQRSHNSVRQRITFFFCHLADDVTPFKVNGDPSTLTRVSAVSGQSQPTLVLKRPPPLFGEKWKSPQISLIDSHVKSIFFTKQGCVRKFS